MLKIFPVLVIMVVGLVSAVWRGGAAIAEIFTTATLADFNSGAVSGKLDKAVFDAIPRSPRLDGLAAGLQYSLLHDAGLQVWAGCSEWLYSIEELRADRHDAENLRARARMFPLLVRALLEHNILLLVLPVPDKAEQVENQLCGANADRSRWRSQLWSDATASVERLEIDVKDKWPQPGYFRTDTHWNNQGAEFAAKAVARAIEARLGPGSDRVVLRTGPDRERLGDLARMAGLAEAPRGLAPALERELELKADVERSGSLLDEPSSPSVILAGSSFSLNSGFLDYLQVSLSREIGQLSQAGGGFAGALLELVQRRQAVLASTKAVIWEFPMRSLTAPLTADERAFLDQLPDSR
ncbi:MAG: hypothetical protein HY852_08390 [Bradyrhizobium sp.]|uniref:alginate O-acetyltransferase AlgX-related protein n=1 Tax=Bradyrhizobium sp. TaxID=376 RepID=UPI0025C11C3D|nr:hypothetical protein [Bradyrhizobium sp.]MBI5261817.1 hypothetical protein [Bradyrhizobium sp.]